jgi:hypothetical protein
MPTMKYIRIANDGCGGSKFEEVEVQQTEMPFAENVPPLLVSGTTAATGVMFVTSLADMRETEPHRTPRRQFAIVLEGELEFETTDGERRTLTPGMVALAEDIEGRGHVTRVRSLGPATIMAIALAD